MTEGVTMSSKETERINVMEKLIRGEIKHSQASKILAISIRQSKRLKKRYKQSGTKGLVHQGRGRPSNCQIEASNIASAITIVKKDYADFGPTFAHEKLTERDSITFSVERLRQAMIKEGLWRSKRRKDNQNHPSRDRRSCFGELVQLDGSPHKWFEDRAPACTLIAYIDDATSNVLYAEFVKSESTWSYFTTFKAYLNQHGKPLALYSDKHGVFRINASKDGSAYASDSHGHTQFGRAMARLKITMIHANSPQAKGRVERLFQTLQDRLVKELRLQGISSMEAGNLFLPKFLKAHNAKFAVAPMEPTNMHRQLMAHDNLEKTLSIQEERWLSKTLTCQYENKIYQVQTEQSAYILRNVKVLVSEAKDGVVTIFYKNKPLSYSIVKKYPKAIDVDAKQLNHVMDKVKAKRSFPKPAPNHPWRKTFIKSNNTEERSLVCQR